MRAKIACGFGLAMFAGLVLFCIWPPLLLDLAGGLFSGDFYWFKGDVRQLSRRHEKLPAVSIENGDTVYCRMRACDFRFPLPRGSQFIKTELVERGFDTINGFIYVKMTNGTAVNLAAYEAQLNKYHLAEGGWVSPDQTNNLTQIRFSYFGDY